MTQKPIFVATHPRACSTAFERVFMTRRDTLQCVHEPFGDAFYFGPERLSERYEDKEKERIDSGFSQSTYNTVVEGLAQEGAEGKRLFIKDIAHYLVPPNSKPASIAPSLAGVKRGIGTNGSIQDGAINGASKGTPYPYHTDAEDSNPTVIPEAILRQFHFTFLIRHPRSSIPSYYRCTIPPLDDVTGFHNFMPSEAGYDELRRIFDYLRSVNQIGPKIAGNNGSTNGPREMNCDAGKVEICVVDADDLLDNPSGIIEAYCKSVGLGYDPKMLCWDNKEDQFQAKEAFKKWRGFHEDAIHSSELKPRQHKKTTKTNEDDDAEWTQKYGKEGAKVIRTAVDANIANYEYLKKFVLKV